MKIFWKLILPLFLCMLNVDIAKAEDLCPGCPFPDQPPCPSGPVNSCNWTPNCDFPEPPPSGDDCSSLPIDNYIFPMLLISIGLGFYAVQHKTKKTPN